MNNRLNARGINCLLNADPDCLGRIPGPSVDILREAGKMSGAAGPSGRAK